MGLTGRSSIDFPLSQTLSHSVGAAVYSLGEMRRRLHGDGASVPPHPVESYENGRVLFVQLDSASPGLPSIFDDVNGLSLAALADALAKCANNCQALREMSSTEFGISAPDGRTDGLHVCVQRHRSIDR